MLRATWEVLPDAGERYLEIMGREAREWQRHHDVEYDLLDYKDCFTPVMHSIGERALSQGMANGLFTNIDAVARDIYAITEALSEEDRLQIVRTHIAAMALQRISALTDGGTLFRAGRGLARVTVVKEGVLRSVGLIEEGHGIHRLRQSQPVEPGAQIKGKVWEFTASPQLGGRLRLEKWGTTLLTGLVDPSTGEPRVELDILAKYRKK